MSRLHRRRFRASAEALEPKLCLTTIPGAPVQGTIPGTLVTDPALISQITGPSSLEQSSIMGITQFNRADFVKLLGPTYFDDSYHNGATSPLLVNFAFPNSGVPLMVTLVVDTDGYWGTNFSVSTSPDGLDPVNSTNVPLSLGQALVEDFAAPNNADSVYLAVQALNPTMPWFVGPASTTGYVNALQVSAGPIQTTQITLDQVHQIIPLPVGQMKPQPAAPKHATAKVKANYAKQQKLYKNDHANYLREKPIYDANAQALVDFLNSNLARNTYQINTPQRVAAFIGQVAVETGSLTTLVQKFNKGETPADTYDIGRGMIQLTGKSNYEAADTALGTTLVANPNQLGTNPALAAKVSGWFWNANGLNKYADTWDIAHLSAVVNTGHASGVQSVNKLPDRQAFSDTALGVLEAPTNSN